MKDFEFFEHTADVGVRVYGQSIEELFKNAAVALFKLLVDYQPKKDKTKKIHLGSETQEELLVHWLNELISIFFADKFLPADFQISIEKKKKQSVLKADISGDDFNPYERKINTEIKAATFHNLKIEKDNRGFKVEIIFDV